MTTSQARKISQPIRRDAVEDDDAIYDTRPHSSVRRYRTVSTPAVETPTSSKPSRPLPPKAAKTDVQELLSSGVRRRSLTTAPPRTNGMASSAITTVKTEELARLRRSPWLFAIGGMFVMVMLLLAVIGIGSWWTNLQNNIHYGYPRTYQFDAVVGHNDSAAHPTHFILLNLHGHIEVFEIPGGNTAQTRVYSGPTLYGPNSDMIPVTGEVRDVNGDGKPDLVLHVQGQQIILLNAGKTFQPASQ